MYRRIRMVRVDGQFERIMIALQFPDVSFDPVQISGIHAIR